MIGLLAAAAFFFAAAVVYGLDDRLRARREARAALARARAAHTPFPPPVTYREAHERLHAASRALPFIPHQRTKDPT